MATIVFLLVFLATLAVLAYAVRSLMGAPPEQNPATAASDRFSSSSEG